MGESTNLGRRPREVGVVSPLGGRISVQQAAIGQVRFAGGNRVSRLALMEHVSTCAYCGEGFDKQADSRPKIAENRPKNVGVVSFLDQKNAYLAQFRRSFAPEMSTFDHIRPHDAGGHSQVGNGLLACSPCNFARGNTPLLEYLL